MLATYHRVVEPDVFAAAVAASAPIPDIPRDWHVAALLRQVIWQVLVVVDL